MVRQHSLLTYDFPEVDRAIRRLAGMTPRALAAAAAWLAVQDEDWVRHQVPGLVEDLGDGWRGELGALALAARRRSEALRAGTLEIAD
jgi:hypothetical protein